MNLLDNERRKLRAATRLKRQSLSLEIQQQSEQNLCDKLMTMPNISSASHVAIYLQNDGEVNLSIFTQWCWANNINTYLPVIHPFSKGHLLFLKYHQHSVMKSNQYGILEPKLNVNEVLPIENLDIIFTPLVAFSSQGERLGMGGGYYDRTLASWYKNKQKNNKPYPIGLAHDCQKVASIPTQHWDIPIPEIITPTAHYQFF